MGGVPGPRGVYLVQGVPGGVYLVWGVCTCREVYLSGGVPSPRGVPGPRGVLGPGGCTWSHGGVTGPGGYVPAQVLPM